MPGNKEQEDSGPGKADGHQIAHVSRDNGEDGFWESDDEQPLAGQQQADPPASAQIRDGCWGGQSPGFLLTIGPLQSLVSAIWNSGVLCMAISASIQSCSALFVKLTGGRVPIFEIVFIRSLICTLFTAVLIKARGLPNMLGSMKYLYALFMRGFCGATSMSVYYFGMFRLTLPDAVTVYFTNPAMTVLLAWLIRGETVRLSGLLGVLLAMTGVLFVSQPPFLLGGEQWTAGHISGVIACLLAAFISAGAYISIRYIPKSEPSICVAMWFHFMGLVTTGIPLAIGVPTWPVLPSLPDLACVVSIGLGSFASQILIARSLQLETAGKAAAAGYLQVVFAYVFGAAFLGEEVQLLSVTGSIVICLGVVATSWPNKKDEAPTLPISAKDASEMPTNELVPLTEQTGNGEVEGLPETSKPVRKEEL